MCAGSSRQLIHHSRGRGRSRRPLNVLPRLRIVADRPNGLWISREWVKKSHSDPRAISETGEHDCIGDRRGDRADLQGIGAVCDASGCQVLRRGLLGSPPRGREVSVPARSSSSTCFPMPDRWYSRPWAADYGSQWRVCRSSSICSSGAGSDSSRSRPLGSTTHPVSSSARSSSPLCSRRFRRLRICPGRERRTRRPSAVGTGAFRAQTPAHR